MGPSTRTKFSRDKLAVKARLFPPFHSTSTYIGLDIGSRLIKMVQLTYRAQQWQLVDVRVEEILHQSEGTSELNENQGVEAAMQRLIQNARIRANNVAVSLSGPSVTVKSIEIPWMSEKELEGHFEYEVERYLPFERDDIYWDYHVSQSEMRNPSSTMNVCLVAAKKEVVEQRIALVRQVGLHPVVVDIDCVALANMYEVNTQKVGQTPGLLVNLSPSGLNMIAVGMPECFYMREVALGPDWSQLVLDECVLLNRDGENAGEDHLGQTTASYAFLAEVYKEITNEIRRAIEDCQSCENHQGVQRVSLCGGYAPLPGIVDRLSSQLGLPVDLMDPFACLNVADTVDDRSSLQTLSSLSGVAVGLAVRCGHGR